MMEILYLSNEETTEAVTEIIDKKSSPEIQGKLYGDLLPPAGKDLRNLYNPADDYETTENMISKLTTLYITSTGHGLIIQIGPQDI